MYICSFILKFVYKYNDIQKLQPEVLCDIESSEASKESFNNKSVNVEECLITFETLRKYLGHVPGFTRSAPAAFLLTASRCTFWYLVQPLDRIPVETWPAWYGNCTRDRHAHAPNVETVRQVSLNVPNNPPNDSKNRDDYLVHEFRQLLPFVVHAFEIGDPGSSADRSCILVVIKHDHKNVDPGNVD